MSQLLEGSSWLQLLEGFTSHFLAVGFVRAWSNVESMSKHILNTFHDIIYIIYIMYIYIYILFISLAKMVGPLGSSCQLALPVLFEVSGWIFKS